MQAIRPGGRSSSRSATLAAAGPEAAEGISRSGSGASRWGGRQGPASPRDVPAGRRGAPRGRSSARPATSARCRTWDGQALDPDGLRRRLRLPDRRGGRGAGRLEGTGQSRNGTPVRWIARRMIRPVPRHRLPGAACSSGRRPGSAGLVLVSVGAREAVSRSTTRNSPTRSSSRSPGPGAPTATTGAGPGGL